MTGVLGVLVGCAAVFYARRADEAAREGLRLEREKSKPDHVLFARRMLPVVEAIARERTRARANTTSLIFNVGSIVDPFAYGQLEDAARAVGKSGEVLELRRVLDAIASRWANTQGWAPELRARYADELAIAEAHARAILNLKGDDPIPHPAELTAHIERYG